jgi:hypothetical protein
MAAAPEVVRLEEGRRFVSGSRQEIQVLATYQGPKGEAVVCQTQADQKIIISVNEPSANSKVAVANRDGLVG